MTGSPFTNVLPTDQDSSTFEQVETTQVGDSTSLTNVAASDTGSESSIAVESTVDHVTHESGQDETQDQSDVSGLPETAT